MGILFRAAIGFAIALALLGTEMPWARWDNTQIEALRADLAAASPGEKFERSLLRGVERRLARDGTGKSP